MTPELRKRVLREWRGLPQSVPRTAIDQPIAETLAKVMQRLGLKERVHEAEILSAWKGIVGDFIAGHSRPDRIRDGVLFVQVLQPTVHYELDRVWKPQIIEKLARRFGKKVIRDIRFRVG